MNCNRRLMTLPESWKRIPRGNTTLALTFVVSLGMMLGTSTAQSQTSSRHAAASGAPLERDEWTSPETSMKFVWLPDLKLWAGKYEVTNAEYRRKEPHHDSMRSEGRSLNGDRQPVVYVNFDDAQSYARWLTDRDRDSPGFPRGATYRLPTAKEWQAMAQCEDGRRFPWGNDWPPRSGQAGNYFGQESFGRGTKIAGFEDGHPVSAPVDEVWENPWGLHGVGGNVWECTTRTPGGTFDGWRGASWAASNLGYLGVGLKGGSHASTRIDNAGFRLVLAYGMLPVLDQTPETALKIARNSDGEHPRPIVAIKDVCAWPNVKRLPDGALLAFLHNKPSHLTAPGDLECWASRDAGRTWSKRGTPGPHDEKAWTRGNVAAGIGPDGHPVTLVGGWTADWRSGGKVLAPIASLSQDGGETWHVHEDAFPEGWPTEAHGSIHSPHGYLIPFGDIQIDTDGALVAGLYSHNKGATFLYRSGDKGRTWYKDPVPMDAGEALFEPALIHLGRGRWLCTARSNGLKVYVSDDDAKTWTLRKQLLSGLQYPAHLARLSDNSLLLSYGNRDTPKGVDVRFSFDEGENWSEPYRLINYQGDGGYPSSIALPDGQVLTAYYAKNIEGHAGYHMGVVVWNPVATRTK